MTTIVTGRKNLIAKAFTSYAINHFGCLYHSLTEPIVVFLSHMTELKCFSVMCLISDSDKCNWHFKCPSRMCNRCLEPIWANWAIVILHDVSLLDSRVIHFIHYSHSLWITIFTIRDESHPLQALQWVFKWAIQWKSCNEVYGIATKKEGLTIIGLYSFLSWSNIQAVNGPDMTLDKFLSQCQSKQIFSNSFSHIISIELAGVLFNRREIMHVSAFKLNSSNSI